MSCNINIKGTTIPSKLYNDLSKVYSTQQQVDEIYGMVMGKYFRDQFGDYTTIIGKPLPDGEFVGRVDSFGEPFLFQNKRTKKYYFKMKDGSKYYLDKKALNVSYQVREGLIQAGLFQLFGNNVLANAETLENTDLNQLNDPNGAIYSMLGGNQVDINDLKDMVARRLASMKIKVYEREDNPNLEEITNQEEGVTNNSLGISSSFEHNDKDNASANMKFFLSFIPEMERGADGRARVKQSVIESNGQKYVFINFYPFDQMWKMLQSTLADTVDFYQPSGEVIPIFDTMINKLMDKYPQDPTIRYVVNKLRKMPDYKKNEFVQAFSTHKIKFYTSTFKGDGENVTFKFFRSDAATDPRKRIVNEAIAGFTNAEFLTVDSEGQYQLDEVKLKTIGNKFNKLRETINKAYTEDTDFNPEWIIQIQKGLQSLGVFISPEALSAYATDLVKNSESDKNRSTEGLVKMLDKVVPFLVDPVTNLTQDQVIKENVVTNPFSILSGSGRKYRATTQLNELAGYEAEFRKDMSENTIMGAEGKKYWTYSYPSFLSNKVKRITQDVADGFNNAATNGELPLQKGFYENSIWLGYLNDPVRYKDFFKHFDIIHFSNFRKEGVADEGAANKDMTAGDQIADQVNKTLMKLKPDEQFNAYYTPTPSDKSTLMHIIGAPFFKGLLTSDGNFSDRAYRIFQGYVIDEINRTLDEMKYVNDPDKYKDRLYKDYHWVGSPNRFKDADGNYLGNAFKPVLFKKLGIKNPVVRQFIKQSGDSYVLDKEAFLASQDVKNIIQEDLNKWINTNQEFLQKEGVLIDGKFNGIDQAIVKHYKEANTDHVKALMTDYVLNNIISNIEFSKVFAGDYAFYKNMVDLSKRYPATYTDGIQLMLKEGDPQDFKLAVLPNQIMDSFALDEMPKEIAAMYKKINATDAQGYITPQRWKFIMERGNHWNPKFEAAYQRIMDGVPTQEDYKYAMQPIKGVHFENTFGRPTYIKYSAAVLIPSAIKGTPLHNLYEAMIAQGVDEAVVVDGVKVGAVIPSEVNLNRSGVDLKDFVNYSGGASGSDKYWETVGKSKGLGKQVNYVPNDLKKLSQEQLEEVEKAYQKAVSDLGRKPLDKNSFAGGLVRRDYLQAKKADAVFAISTILEPGQKDKKGYTNNTNKQVVEGGTGYAVQMAINLDKPVYVFDQIKNKWFTWDGNKFINTDPPVLSKNFAGIGTRELNENGKKAIEDIFTRTANKPNISLNSITLRNNNYKIQQDLRPKGVKPTLLGSQIKKVILTNLAKTGEFGDEVIELTNMLLSDLSNRGLKKLAKRTGITKDGIADKELFYEALIDHFRGDKGNENILKALELGLDLDVIANHRQKIQNAVNSMINAETVKIKTNGGSFIQMSSWGLNEFDAEATGIKWVGAGAQADFKGLKAPTMTSVFEKIVTQNKVSFGDFTIDINIGPDTLKAPIIIDGKTIGEIGISFSDWITLDARNGDESQLPDSKKFKSNEAFISGVEIYEEFKGKGFGKEAYKELINKLGEKGFILTSGINTSTEAKRVWESLLKENIVTLENDEYSSKKLFRKKVKPGQVFITSEYLSRFVPDWKSMKSSDLNKLIDREAFNLIGYRIPNQGLSSNDSLEIVGILPEGYGDTIVPYIDITTKTGSDFDIDKMYVMIPNLRQVFEEATYTTALQYLDSINISRDDIISEYEDLEQSGIVKYDSEWLAKLNDNQLRREFITDVVLNPNINGNAYYTDYINKFGIGKLKKLEYIKYDESKPASEQSAKAVENKLMETFTRILQHPDMYEDMMAALDSKALPNDIEDLHGKENLDIDGEFFGPAYQLQKKFDNAGGKSGVGIEANHITDQAWTQMVKLGFMNNIMIGNDSNGFSGEWDAYGETKITHALSWLLTAYVDIAKDPFISKGNHNTYTANTANMLIRAGVPWTMVNRIIGQDSVKIAAKIQELRNSRIAPRDTRSLRQAVIEALAQQYNLTPTGASELAKSAGTFNYENFINKFDIESDKKKGLKELEKYLEDNIKGASSFVRQLELFDLFTHFRNIGEDFGKTVTSSKQDVNGAGKDFISAFTNLNSVIEAASLGFTNYMSKFDNTFLGTALENSVMVSIPTMEQLFITANQAAQSVYNAIDLMLDPDSKGLTDARLGNDLEKAYYSYIVGSTNAFNLKNEEIIKMFKGTNTIYDRLLKAKQKVPDNFLLQNFRTDIEPGNWKFISMDSTRLMPPEGKNELYRSWDGLLNSSDPFLKKFGEDLIKASFFTTGFSQTIKAYFEYIPPTALNNMMENDIKTAKNNFSGNGFALNEFVDKLFRNNWKNDKLVPVVKHSVVIKGPLTGLLTVMEEVGTENKKAKKPYIRTVEYNPDGTSTERLYKNLGSIENNVGKKIHYFKQVPPLGYNDDRGHTIVEYNSSIGIDEPGIVTKFDPRLQERINIAVNNLQNTQKFVPYNTIETKRTKFVTPIKTYQDTAEAMRRAANDDLTQCNN